MELATGLRRGEILALQWRDLNLRTGALRVERQVHRVKGELAVSPPKTKAGNRTVLLPAPVLNVLKTYKQAVHSRWMFPSPVKEDSPMDPAAVRKRLQTVLERAECKRLRFHDLRHTFATASLEHGMDIKTLSTIIGHVSSTTTLNTYTHVTDAMRQNAADKIDQESGRAEPKPRQEAAPQKPAPQHLPGPQGTAAQTGHRLCQPNQRPPVGGPLLPHLQWPAHGPECVRKDRGRVRNEAGGADPGDERGDRRSERTQETG